MEGRTDCAGVCLHGGVEVCKEVDDIGLRVALLNDGGSNGEAGQGEERDV